MGRPKKIRPADYSYQIMFNTQKQNARRRGIPFEFTYESWIDWWGDDIVNRGRGTDKLVMARNNDTGAYSPDNVRKATGSDNVSEGNLGKIVSEHTRKILSEQKIGKPRDLLTKIKISETLKSLNKEKETEICS